VARKIETRILGAVAKRVKRTAGNMWHAFPAQPVGTLATILVHGYRLRREAMPRFRSHATC
jgi:hypothetical protein